ncbi:hypothetical protein FDENT_13009 [Fusarium denticulatum]|uniref:Uncharacterized protein n=1 Tax=Fusarium denticulatum TaxID=48507 RepID=A0A8H5WMV4_9HYPO|nr:hypothetical protein FDENT_13009 [Fusarium denticulatum]
MDLFDLDDGMLFDPDLDFMPDAFFDFEYWEVYDDGDTWYDVDAEPDVRPRCGLCQFKFEAFDSIVVFKPLNPYLPTPWEGKYFGIDAPGALETGYHSSCVDQFAVDLSPGDNTHIAIWNATRYGDTKYGNIGNEPLPSFEANRLRRLKKMFAEEFMTTIGGRLPLEVCENIGRYCLRDCAARLFKDAWGKKSHFGTRDAAFRVTKSHEVWAQHIEFEGIQYIKSLSTTRRNESDTKLFGAAHGTRVNIYFAEDLLGIREVIITQDDDTPLTQGEGFTWVVNRRIALPFWFKSKSDGLKLRELAITRTKKLDANFRQRRWALLPDDLDACRLAPPLVCDTEVPMEPIRAVDWNLPGCRGYSILIDMNRVSDIIPNNTKGPSSQFMDVDNKHWGAWIYIPIDENERVAELWFRKGEFPRNDSSPAKCRSLIIRTSKGRSFALGSNIESRSTKKDVCKFTYQGIAVLLSTLPSRMLYCKARPSNFWLCVNPAKSLDLRRIDLSLPRPSKPTAFTGKQFLSSVAELRDVRTIAVCRNRKSYVGEEVVGLLLTYADGRQRCLGHIRLDHMDAPLLVTSGKTWLGSEKSDEEPLPKGFWPRTKQIKWVGVEKPFPDEKLEYLEVSLEGSLEWHSYNNRGHYDHAVHHLGSSELQDTADEMDGVLAHETTSEELDPLAVKTFAVEF